jgi:hypothetical protein
MGFSALNGGDDLELAAAVRAVFHVGGTLEQIVVAAGEKVGLGAVLARVLAH